MISKKAQSSFEFLTTYGWALMIMVVMFGALVYYLNAPSSAVQPSCTIVEAFGCRDSQVQGNTVSLALTNIVGTGIMVNNLECVYDGVHTSTSSNATGVHYDAGQKFVATCDFAAGTLPSKGSTVKVNFNIKYTKDGYKYPAVAQGSSVSTAK